MASAKAAKMKSTAEAFVMAFEGEWSEETIKKVLAPRAPGCQHRMLPSSLNMPTKSNEEWEEYFKSRIGLVKDCKMTIHDTIVAADAGRVVCRSSMTSQTPFGPFPNEYCWFFTFDECGDKIVQVDEMFDSAAVKDILARIQQSGASS